VTAGSNGRGFEEAACCADPLERGITAARSNALTEVANLTVKGVITSLEDVGRWTRQAASMSSAFEIAFRKRSP